MTEILITGITGLRNRGVDALVDTIIDGIRNVISNNNITVLTDTPDYDLLNSRKENIQYFLDYSRTNKGRLLENVSFLPNKIIKRISSSYSHYLNLVEKADLIIASGGDVFSSDYGDMANFLHVLQQAIKKDKKVIFLGHSIGPFKTIKESKLWIKIAKHSELISTRESYSYNYIINELKIPKEKVYLTADPAFLLKIPNELTLNKMMEFYNIDDKKPIVTLSMSQGIQKFAGLKADDHLYMWKEIIRTLLEQLNVQILLIPHVQERNAFNDDRILATKIVRMFDYNRNIKLISGDHSASEYKGIISKSELVIAERMHAAIAGLSSGVATSVIGYSVKARGIMNDILGEKNAINLGALTSIDNVIKNNDISRWLLNLWSNRETLTKIIKKKLPDVKKQSLLNFKLLKEIIERMNGTK